MKAERTLETTGQDWANHLSHEVSGSGTIYIAALLAGKPDVQILRQATEDLIALQTVLGCRFDDMRDPPVWVPADDTGRFTQADASGLREGLEAFMHASPTRDRQMEVRLISYPGQTVLCLGIDHAAADGGGVKMCLSLLSKCYNLRLAGERMPESILPDRSEEQVFARCGLPDFRMALRREAPSSDPVVTVPYKGLDGHKPQYRWISMPLSAVRRPGGTVNDRLLAAFARALPGSCAQKGPIAIHMTVDLRRYLDEAAAPAACNLSGMEAVSVTVSPQDSFAATLASVQRQTALLKENRPGLSSAAMMAYLRTMPYSMAREALLGAGRKSRLSGTAAPILSNLGLIFPGTMHFGDAVVTEILPFLPILNAPAFMLGAGGYGDVLTLSAGFYAEERDAGEVERLLAKIRDALQCAL